MDLSILEKQRSLHEERERIIGAMVVENLEKKQSHRDQVNSDHRIKVLLDRSLACAKQLEDDYNDEDGSRKEEMNKIAGPNEFPEFYSRLRNIKEFHRLRPQDAGKPLCFQYEQMNIQVKENDNLPNMVEFSDEEGYGRFLDLHEHYNRYVNIKGISKIEYLDYLTIFDKLFDISKDKKNSLAYKDYVNNLMSYLYEYAEKVKPLIDFEQDVLETKKDFEEQWAKGQFPGWTESNTALKSSGAPLDLTNINSAEELEKLGLDRLKSALMALGLKCGGTLTNRAERLFSTKGLSDDQIPASIKAKKSGKGKEAARDGKKEIAFVEAQIYRLIEILGEQREMTRDNVERKQARTEDERMEDEEDEEFVEEEEEEEEDDIIYNPKNLPLGWDGKPIPYWLYKLHGLNIDYKCQICGNQTYRGPKAFQRHFSEWRHAHGMRCLGIPNTAHFANVTEIEDALALWAKLKEQKASEKFNPHMDEEFEDSLGNVVNRKTYDDMRRQGIL